LSNIKVFFIRSGNHGIDPISTLQGISLEKAGVEVHYYDIVGKGFLGYLQNIVRFRKLVKSTNVDLIHAHYSFSGFLAALSFSGRPVVTSLMGSDVKSDKKFRALIYLFSIFFWERTIVKSADMQKELGIRDIEIIPNGVDLDVFCEVEMMEARSKIGLQAEEKVVLFAADPDRPEKNFVLAQEAIRLTGFNIRILFLKNVEPVLVKYYFNAADVVLLTSLWEGSPNVVKEAMACNTPVIATDVGDVSWLIGDTEGCFVTRHNSAEIADKIRHCINSVDKSQGRGRIISLNLDSVTVSEKIIEVYRSVLVK